MYVCVSLLLIYHLLSTQEMCEKKRLNEKKKKRKKEHIDWGKRKTRGRERANSIVSSNSNSSAMPLLTCLSTLIHTQLLLRRPAYNIYQSYSSCQTSRECIYCAPDVTIVFYQWAIYYIYDQILYSNVCSFVFFFAILNNSRSLFPSLSCTWRFILLEIGLLSRSLARL
jgi:hypothetical protein